MHTRESFAGEIRESHSSPEATESGIGGGHLVGRVGPLDLLFFLLTSASLVVLCLVRSRTRLMWSDELLGYGVLTAPSLRDTLAGWYQGADGGGIFFYLFGRIWMEVFHPSALSVRLYSTFSFIGSIGLIWWVARRFYAFAPVAIGVFFVYLTPDVVMWQEVNGRFYGFFMFAAALAVTMTLLTAEKDRLTTVELIGTAAAHALLIGSHILGLVYSASLIVALAVLDLSRRRIRWKLYASALGGWIMLPISAHAILASTSIAEKTFWTTKPRLIDLTYGATLFDQWMIHQLLFAIALFNVGYLMRGRADGHPTGTGFTKSYHPAVFTVVGAIFLAEVVLFAKSRFGISVFADRYLLPIGLALVLLIAEGLSPFFRDSFFAKRSSAWRSAAVAAILLVAFSSRSIRKIPYDFVYPRVGYPERLLNHLPPEKTIVVTFMPTFLLLRAYDPTHHYVYLLDRTYDRSPRASMEDHSLQHLMENWKNAGLAKDDILSFEDILSADNNFTLLTDPSRDIWLKDRLSEPSLSLQPVTSYDEWFQVKVWTVQRRDSHAARQ
ncbi:hypothetical protein [Granulicella sibirica]|uniref:Glycosyltransferase RgtA/B/C/D-like domain-containing protein n=1 Tax=Granulicella sibirica TaxID=2479048 RepID=A0A4Q0T789_9BACT|nr:hypothetical protein [Granulicella sibirica]RXH58922.1 hypothetical protein GRAN_2232 [Granulicella sibirica]